MPSSLTEYAVENHVRVGQCSSEGIGLSVGCHRERRRSGRRWRDQRQLEILALLLETLLYEIEGQKLKLSLRQF